jgi:PIN domain nuclease of toxin-antitoxin system
LRLLLDTHIWLWALRQPDRLSALVRKELFDLENELWLSPVSTWEALLLHATGRLTLSQDVGTWVARSTAHVREAPLTHEISVAAYELETEHRDPADRLLAATAQVLGLTLVTADQRLLGLKKLATLANR